MPVVWTVPPPQVSPGDARLELTRRYLHIYGPATPEAFRRWAGISLRSATSAFEALGGSLTPVRTPVGEAWILTGDEAAFRADTGPAAPARLLPSGDAYFLLYAADRALLVPDEDRRAGPVVTVQPWRRMSPGERDAVTAEAESVPLPGLGDKRIVVRWDE